MRLDATTRELIELAGTVASAADLRRVMTRLTARLGFQHFALSHHVEPTTSYPMAIRLNDYPEAWDAFYAGHQLAVSDPVHRASHVTSVGFCWSRIPTMIKLTARDRQILALGRAKGIGDGFTIPANVPGELRGSCSFANDATRPLPIARLPMAQLAGAFAFEAARHLVQQRGQVTAGQPSLTDRQRDCVLWAARGKSDWEISRILGVSEETVARHIKEGFVRYGVNKRTLLAIWALFDGTLTFSDIVRR